MTGATRQLPMFPLSTVLFPGMLLPLQIFEPRYRRMLDDCLARTPQEFGVVLIARGSEVGGGDERTDLGTVARIEALRRADDGRAALIARGMHRVRVVRWLPDDPYPHAVVEELPDAGDGGFDLPPGCPELAAAAALIRRVDALRSELGHATSATPPGPDASLWELCARLPVNALDRQRLLATDDPTARAALLVELAGALAEDLTRLLSGS